MAKAPVSHAPGRADIVRTRTDALSFPRSIRRHNARAITSLPAGKSVPIFASGLLREDAVRSGRLRFQFEMMETAEIIMNPINVRVMAYFVPMLALDRFQGSMDNMETMRVMHTKENLMNHRRRTGTSRLQRKNGVAFSQNLMFLLRSVLIGNCGTIPHQWSEDVMRLVISMDRRISA